MNKETKTFKIDAYTVNLHRGKDEPEEIGQRRMAMLVNHLKNIAIKPIHQYIARSFPELQHDIIDIIKQKGNTNN